jgi:hypothetical protein
MSGPFRRHAAQEVMNLENEPENCPYRQGKMRDPDRPTHDIQGGLVRLEAIEEL